MNTPTTSWRFCIALFWFILTLSLVGNVQARGDAVLLQGNLGDHHYPVTTSVPKAQQYFDQGLVLAYGFNHAEAARSFREAQKHDPTCAMCFWGEALVLGPNINAPMDDSVVPQAYAAAQHAMSLREKANGKERALIQAVAKRYVKEVPTDRSVFDLTYAEAMRQVAGQFPTDPVIGGLLAEALMDVHPWDFWTKEGNAQPWTSEIVSVLEAVLKQTPGAPLANHLYIHTMESSPHPEKAIPSAERLATLVPGSGHLVHMPAHIYIRVGRYRDSASATHQASQVDQDYLSHSHTESLYTAAYIPHNIHFSWAAASKLGQQEISMKAAQDTAANVSLEGMRDPAFAGTLQHFWLMPLFTQALFGQWDSILLEPLPPTDLLYPVGMYHYARGLAFIRQSKLEQANKELDELRSITKNPGIAGLTIFDLNAVPQILELALEVLAGEISAKRGDYDAAVTHLNTAIVIEDGLNYTEPKDWYLPPRQVLGAVFLEAGKAEEAELVYREDLHVHPQNGWSLFGLGESLRIQGKLNEAKAVQQEFEEAWADADVVLTSSRF